MPTIKTGEWLKVTLVNEKMTQKQLANATGLAIPTIAKIISGERFGSSETWDKINKVLCNAPKISLASDKFIEELKEEIEEYGLSKECFIFYEKKNGNILFKDYALQEDLDDQKFPTSDLNKMHKLKVTLEEALELFTYQNKII